MVFRQMNLDAIFLNTYVIKAMILFIISLKIMSKTLDTI